MMSRAWSEKHGVQKAQDFNGKQETHAVRHANGTGAFRLERYEPDVRTVLKRHAAWWGAADPAMAKRNGNLTEVVFVTIKSDATRLAALASGEVDLVLDPPYQDVARLKADSRIALAQRPDIGQQYLAFDQARDELEFSDVKGRNPFKDLRVRQAVYHAVNVPLIIDKVLRGQGQPTGALLSPLVTPLLGPIGGAVAAIIVVLLAVSVLQVVALRVVVLVAVVTCQSPSPAAASLSEQSNNGVVPTTSLQKPFKMLRLPRVIT
jgi:peptide/nickel transport system substrate-binding protein